MEVANNSTGSAIGKYWDYIFVDLAGVFHVTFIAKFQLLYVDH
jgi:hypothetical protein